MTATYIVSTGVADAAYVSTGSSSVDTSSSLTSFKRIRNALISVTRDLVGSSLSTVSQNGEKVPSVLKDISGGNLPSYPFIVIANNDSTGVQSTKIVSQSLNENGKLEIVNDNYISFTLKAYGEDSSSILSDLKIKLNFDYDRRQFEEDAEATLMEFSDISYQPVFLSERFIPSSEMAVRLTSRTIYRPSGFYETKGIEVSGEVQVGNDGESIQITINENNE